MDGVPLDNASLHMMLGFLLANQGNESEFFLTDIGVGYVGGNPNTKEETPNLVELVLFGLENEPDGKAFPLVEAGLRKWKVEGSIKLPPKMDGVLIVVKSEDGGDVGCTALDNSDLQRMAMGTRQDFYQRMETFNEALELALLWNVCEIPSELTLPLEVLPGCLLLIGKRLLEAFEQTGNLSDIAGAVSAHQRAVELSPPDYAGLSSGLNNLGISLMRRFEHTGNIVDITEAITAQQKAVQLTPQGHEALPSYLNNLGASFSCRFENTGDPADITEAIAAQQKAVQITPQGHADLPLWLNSLGGSFINRFKHTRDIADVAEAIKFLRKAVQLTPQDHEKLPSQLSNLGTSLSCHFDCTGDLADIAEAIAAQQRAVQLTPQGHANLPSWLNNLGNSFTRRFDHTGNLADIAEAIAAQQKAVQLAPQGHASLPLWLSNLGISLLHQFNCTGDLADVDEAIAAQQKAVQLTPQSHANLPALLTNLGNSFLGRFQQTGNLADIAEAIAVQQKAVWVAPQGHADLPSQLNNLGRTFSRRFEHTGDLADIAEAIAAQQKAVQLTPEDHVDLPLRLNNLGNSFLRCFECTGDISNITKAITAQQKAVQLTPQDHTGLPFRLNGLGISFLYRFEHTGNLADIAEAIGAQQKAVQITPQSHATLPAWLTNLGNSFSCRFEHTGDPLDIAEAIAAQDKAVKLTPQGHANLPLLLSNLGHSYLQSASSTDNHKHLLSSISSYRSAATCTVGSPSTRLKAAIHWATLAYTSNAVPSQTLTAFETAIGLLALVAGLEQTIEHRHTQIRKWSSFSLQAAAAACSLGQPDKALEWLEQGRCLVWTQLNRLHTPLDDLALHDKSLAQHFLHVTKKLESAASRHASPQMDALSEARISVEDEAQAHLKLAKEWDKLLLTIRTTIPGFENFLQPVPCTALLQYLPDNGPVVLINVSQSRCDAIGLIAGLDEPLHIPLPGFSYEKAKVYQKNLVTHLKANHLRMRTHESDEVAASGTSGRGISLSVNKKLKNGMLISHTLESLWHDVVKPILDALGFPRPDSSSTSQLPRIWWCPTGPLAFLPLHAAGIYRDGDSESILDYAVSSYTPSITSLTTRVRHNFAINQDVSGLFLTNQPNAPGASPIPGTTKEIFSIFECAVKHGIRVVKLEGRALTVEEGLKHMEEFSSIHLACHASQNQNEPLQSQFLFHNGPLTLSRIIQKDLKNADLAFLSACQTSTGEETLSEEVVHLAAGMLTAGYRRVVGTMWAIGDQHAPEIAKDFYDYLLEHQEAISTGFDGSRSAHALHYAIQQKRKRLDNSQKSLLAWIPYVHFGL